LKNVANVSSIEIKLSEKTNLKEFFQIILDRYPQLKNLLSETSLHEGEFLILINGIDIRVFNDPYNEIIVEDSDEIVFVPVTHGG